MTQVVVFALHMMKCGFRIKMRNAAKKFSDNSEVTVPVFIEVDMIGSRKPIYAKVGRIQAGVEQWDNIVCRRYVVKWIMGREMAEVFHDLLIAIIIEVSVVHYIRLTIGSFAVTTGRGSGIRIRSATLTSEYNIEYR